MNTEQLKSETRKFLSEFEWTEPVAVTLTLKQALSKDGYWVTPKGSDYSQNIRHFLNVLNKKVFGSLARRSWLLSVATVLEHSAVERAHYHLTIDKPPHLSFSQYAWLIGDIWKETTWSSPRVDVSADGGTRWINYITKTKTKEQYDEAIDWQNTHNARVAVSDLDIPFKMRMQRQPRGFIAEAFRKAALDHA